MSCSLAAAHPAANTSPKICFSAEPAVTVGTVGQHVSELSDAEQRRALKRLQAMRAAGTGLTTPQQRHSPQLPPRDSYLREEFRRELDAPPDEKGAG